MTKQINSFKDEYGFLSSFYPCMIQYEGQWYPSVEHAYQAAKTLVESEQRKIANAATPGQAKRLGQKVTLRDDWEEIKIDIMRHLVHVKFADQDLAKQLDATGDAQLVEGNYWGDTFWGVCRGVGKNVLGCILMEVRRHNKVFFLSIWKDEK